MPLLVRKNIRAIGTQEFLYPIMEVERIELISYTRSDGHRYEFELFQLENGMRAKITELLFLEPVDEDLLIAMRLEAQILANGGELPKKRRR